MLNGTGSHWRTSWKIDVMWSHFLLLQMGLAAVLSTNWSPSRRHAGAQAVLSCVKNITRCYHLANSNQVLRSSSSHSAMCNYVLPSKNYKNFYPAVCTI